MVLLQRGELSQELFDELEHAVVQNKRVKREVLEKIYFRAITRMKALARELHTDYFSETCIRHYFRIRHNELLDGMFTNLGDKGIDIDKNAPPALKNLCKVFKSKIIKKTDDYYIVEYFDNDLRKTRPALRSLVPNANVGDEVMIHYGYAVEKVD